jgi:hypothetical protein
LAHDVQRLAAVRRLGGDDEVHLVGKELPQSCTHDGVVVDDGDADHEGWAVILIHDPTFGTRSAS